MQKVIAVLTFVLAGIALASFAPKVEAAGTAYLAVPFKNNGNIPVTVSYYFQDGGNQRIPSSGNYSVAVSGSQTRLGTGTDSTIVEPYKVFWWTNCTPDPVNVQKGADYDALPDINVYWGDQDVTCPDVGGEPTVTASCPTPGNQLSLSWNLSGSGPYNVQKYHLFRSQSPDANPDDNYIETINSSSSSGLKVWSGMTSGKTYYVRVSAESLPGWLSPTTYGTTWSSPAYSSTACQSAAVPPAPTNLRVTGIPSCSDDTYYSGVNLSFNVSGATAAILQLYGNGVLETQYSWPPPAMSAGSSYSLSTGYIGGFRPGTLYTWRVKAGNSAGWSTFVHYNSGNGWYVPRGSSPPHQPANLTVSKPPCIDPPNTFEAQFRWEATGGAPTKTEFNLSGFESGTIYDSGILNNITTVRTISNIPSANTSYTFRVKFGNVGSDGATDWSGWTTLIFDMPACTQPDLVISQLSTDKTDYTPGATVNVTIKIKNNSTGTPPSLIYTWYGNDTETRNMNNMLNCNYDQSYLNQFDGGGYWKFESGMANGQVITYTDTFTVPSTPGTYKIKAVVDGFCTVDEADDSIATMGANNVKQITFNVVSLPTNPGGLSVIKVCTTDNLPFVRFSWSINSQNETGYWLDVNTAEWTGAGSPSPWGVKTVAANQNKFDWHPGIPLDSGTPLGPENNTTYWWRLKAFNGVGDSSHIYPDGPDAGTADDLSPPGGSFTTLDCRPNLQVTGFEVNGGQPGQPIQTVNATVTVKNAGQGYTFPQLTDDTDRDGFTNTEEAYMGTNANSVCSATSIANDQAVHALPADFNDDRIVDNADTALLAAAGFVPYNPRYDLDTNGSINVFDGLIMGPYLGKNCTDFNSFEVAINLLAGTMDCDSVKHATYRASPLGPGASANLTIPVTLPSNLGSHTASAMADSNCEITETNEGDNVSTDDYSVEGFDLSVIFVPDSWNKPSRAYLADETATAQVQITNNSDSVQTFSGLANSLGIWPGQAGEPDLPVCSNTPPVPPNSPSSPPANGGSYDVPSLTPGQTSAPIPIIFNVGSIAGDFEANAYVLFGCTPNDYSWSNNSTVSTGSVTYHVQVDAWFETTGGDVGSDASDGDGGAISVSLSSPPRPQSDYLLVGKTLDPSVSSAKWSINGYEKPLVAANPYVYMAERSAATKGNVKFGEMQSRFVSPR